MLLEVIVSVLIGNVIYAVVMTLVGKWQDHRDRLDQQRELEQQYAAVSHDIDEPPF